MSKKILSLLLVLALVVAVSVFAVEASGTAFDEDSAVDGVVTAYCEACKQDVQWTAATLADDGSLNLAAHAYIPSAGLTVEATTLIEGTVCLYLNGTLQNQTAKTDDYTSHDMFRLTTEATEATDCILNFMGSGSIVNANIMGNIVDIAANASGGINKLAIYSGTFDSSAVTKTSAVYAENGGANVEIHGGTIMGSKIAYDAASAYGAAFNLVGANTFLMTDGTIKDGSVACDAASYACGGGNIRMGKSSTFTMSGGTISGGRVTAADAVRGGNVYLDSCQVSISGDAVISGGRITTSARNNYSSDDADAYGYGGNIYMGSCTGIISGGTISDGQCYNSYEKSTVSTDLRGGSVYQYGGQITMTGGELSSSTGTLNGYSSRCWAGGIYYVTSSGTFTINGEKAQIIGGKATRGGAVTVATKANLHLIKGKISGGVGNTSGGCVHSEGRFIMDGGTVELGSALYGGNICQAGRASSNNTNEFIMNNGTVTGGVASSGGGNVEITMGAMNNTSYSARATMYDGTITGGVCNGTESPHGGGNVQVRGGIFTMEGGLITGGVAESYNGGNVSIIRGNYTSSGSTKYAASTFNLNGGKVVLGHAEHGGNFVVQGNSSASATLNIDGGTVAAGYADKTGSNSHFGGNVSLWDNAHLNMTGGLMTTKYNDGEKSYTGKGANGINIGVWSSSASKPSSITIDGGAEIAGGTSNGGSIEVGNVTSATNHLNITIKDAKIHSASAVDDIYIAAKNDFGTLTIGDGFKDRLIIQSEHAEILTDYAINNEMVVADSTYANKGIIYLRHNKVNYPVVANGTNLVLAQAAAFNGAEEVKYYATVEDASNGIGAVGEGYQEQYVKLLLPATFELTQKTIVDFNGNNATVTGAKGNLIGMDSKTNKYVDEGAAKVTFVGEHDLDNVASLKIGNDYGQRKYLALDNGDGTYSFHRYYISMDKAGLRTDSNDGVKGPGISYSAVFRGDEAVVNAISAYGVAFTVLGNETKYAYTDALAATERNEGKMLAVHGMMNAEYGATPVSGKAYIVVNGETIYSTDAATNNLQALVETYAAQYSAAKLPDIFQTSVGAMLKKYAANMKAIGWNVPEVA